MAEIKLGNIRLVKITKKNINIATKVQLDIFRTENGYNHFLTAINSNKEYCCYFIAYHDNIPIGVTGLYSIEDIEQTNSIWLGWFGIVEEYRKHGYGAEVLMKTIEIAKKFAKKYSAIKYLRLYTSSKLNEKAIPFYRKYMDIEENYRNKKDYTYEDTCIIFTKILLNDTPLKKWNNKFLNISGIIESEDSGKALF